MPTSLAVGVISRPGFLPQQARGCVRLAYLPSRFWIAQAPKSAADIEKEQEALLAKKYGGLAKKKLMPKVHRRRKDAQPEAYVAAHSIQLLLEMLHVHVHQCSAKSGW